MKMDWGNIAERAVWTAVQAFFGALPPVIVLTGPALRAVGLSAVAAAVAALISFGKNLSMERLKAGE